MSNEQRPATPQGPGNPNENFGTENPSFVVNNYFAAPVPVGYSGPVAERDYKGRTSKTVRTRKTLSWVGIAIGAILIVGSPGSPGGFAGVVGSIAVGAAMLLPGVWWLRCEREDRKALVEWGERARRNRELKAMLGEGYDVVANGMGEEAQPTPMDRRWGVIAAISLALFFLGGAVTPV